MIIDGDKGELHVVLDEENGRPVIKISDYDIVADPDDAFFTIGRDDFLDAIVALFEDNVAYQFPSEDDDG